MEVRRDSWHYHWIASKWNNYPKALCWYFWKIMFSVVLWAFGFFVLTVCALFLLRILILPFSHWFGYFEYTMVDQVIAFVMWAGIGGFVSYQYRDWLVYDGVLPERVRKPPGLVVQWLDAKHRKVCPLIEYVDS